MYENEKKHEALIKIFEDVAAHCSDCYSNSTKMNNIDTYLIDLSTQILNLAFDKSRKAVADSDDNESAVLQQIRNRKHHSTPRPAAK